MKSSGLGAVDTAGCVATALDIGDGYVLDGAVALDGSRDALHVRHVRVLVGLVEDVFFAANGSVVDVAVGCDGGREGEGGGDVLHYEDDERVDLIEIRGIKEREVGGVATVKIRSCVLGELIIRR